MKTKLLTYDALKFICMLFRWVVAALVSYTLLRFRKGFDIFEFRLEGFDVSEVSGQMSSYLGYPITPINE